MTSARGSRRRSGTTQSMLEVDPEVVVTIDLVFEIA